MVYIAAANDLEPFILQDQKEMEKIGSNKFINILMYVIIRNQNRNVAKKLIVYKNKTFLVGSAMNIDSGSEESLLDACKWAIQRFPSDQFALVLWDHGAGWRKDRGICFDSNTGNYLTDIKLASALKTISSTLWNSEKIDIIGFDACLMANIETAYAVAPYADYMIASEQTIPGEGWEYSRLLAPLSRGTLSAEYFAKWMVTAYEERFKLISDDFTLSALNLSKLDPLVQNVSEIAQTLTSLLMSKEKKQIKEVIQQSSDNEHCTFFTDPAYIDLIHFYNNMLENCAAIENQEKQNELKSLLITGKQLAQDCVIAHTQADGLDNAYGLSVYLPQKSFDPRYFNLIWSKNSLWAEFLMTYLKI